MRLLPFALVLVACHDHSPATAPDATPDVMPDALACPPARTPDPDPAFEQVLRQLESRMATDQVSGAGFAVFDHGTVVHQATLGARQTGACEPFTEHTRIRLGWPTRSITALAALAAIADGQIVPDRPVTDYIPLHVTNGSADAITIRHLLEHSAGVFISGFNNGCMSQDLVGYWSTVNAQLEYAPGEAVGDYRQELSLLGAILAKQYAKPYGQVVHDLVFAPLGMTTATTDYGEWIAGEHALGGSDLADPGPCALLEPVLQTYVSLDDLVALARRLAQPPFDTVLHDAGKPHFFAEDTTGWGMDSVIYDGPGNHRLYFSDATTASWGGEIDVFDTGKAYVMLENQGADTGPYLDTLITADSGLVFHDPFEPVDTAQWGDYAGCWRDSTSSPPRDITITFDGTNLSGVFAGLPIAFAPLGRDTFSVMMFSFTGRLRFWRDSSGVPQLAASQFGALDPAYRRLATCQ